MTTRVEISEWFDQGVAQGASHMIVMCDTFDHEDYPVFVDSVQEAHARASSPGNMQRVMEVYNLALDKDLQLNQVRSHNY
jgi:hypothetical protein